MYERVSYGRNSFIEQGLVGAEGWAGESQGCRANNLAAFYQKYQKSHDEATEQDLEDLKWK